MKVDQSVINQILDVLDHHGTDIHLLGGYFNNVYEITSEVPIVVKIFNREFNTEQEILSEIEWTQFLHENGVNVSIPIIINGESYINNLANDLFFVAYEKVKGTHIDINGEDWNEQLFKQWGKGMGTMHSLSKKYKGKYKRPEWNEHKIYQMSMDSFDSKIKEKWEQCLENIKSMGKSEELYGIIHGDLNHHNFIYDKGEITYIDFGDSEFNWFAYDIAIAIYHASQTIKDRTQRDQFASIFFNSFIEGYLMENSVNEILKHVDFFVDFRHLYSFVYHNQFSQKDQLNRQQLKYLEEMGQTIIKEKTYLRISLV
ncbi:phosphotransferase [Paenibacillus sp. VCA1]|uniref:phosphotransferase enzyme family protein n=1 Tax=Paenibacillus sp. VCA1 TaxID=3039148 RepID=UPI0028718C31|nr:phosphotransferase [Paenibacillus sp. VCA1]MDR9856206.1 phosphotransferase [Paenibacillus sp. VCA1]